MTPSKGPTVRASIEGVEVTVARAVVDLLPNAEPERVAIVVPRPQLGELMTECNNETTLYGNTLVVEANEGKYGARCA